MNSSFDNSSSTAPSSSSHQRHASPPRTAEQSMRSASPGSITRKRFSRSTILTDGLWDHTTGARRWSAWTADTDAADVGPSNVHLDFEDSLKVNTANGVDNSTAAASQSDQSNFAEDSLAGTSHTDQTSCLDDVEAHNVRSKWYASAYSASKRRDDSVSSSHEPPSPMSETALDAALSSTMLALTTANSLLLSTMASRRELASMRALQNELDSSLARREQDLRRRLDENNQTIAWMEQASQRLDDLLHGREPKKFAAGEEELNELNELVSMQESQRAVLGSPAVAESSAASPRPKLAHSSAIIQPARPLASERVHSSSAIYSRHAQGVVRGDDGHSTVSKSAAKRLERMLQQQGKSADATSGDVDHENIVGPNSRSSSLSIRQGQEIPFKSSNSSTPLLTPTKAEAVQPNPLGAASASAPSPASVLLSAALGSKMQRDAFHPSRPLTNSTSPIMGEAMLGAASDTESDAGIASPAVSSTGFFPSLDAQPNRTQHRTPSALRIKVDSQGSRSSISNAAHSWRGRAGDEEADDKRSAIDGCLRPGRKGALEALRQLNGGSGVDKDDSSSANTTGWSGTLASWVGYKAPRGSSLQDAKG